MDNRDVVIVSAVRTPFGRFDGMIKDIPSIDLGVLVVKEVLARIDLDPAQVDELYYGTCIPAEYAPYLNVPARQITLLAGFPANSISLTIDRACCSSMTALRLGYRAIRSGEAEVVIACGAENMGNACHLVEAGSARWGTRLGHIQMTDILFELGYGKKGFNPVALDAGEVALEYGVTREDQDRWALKSQNAWAKACQEGKFNVGGEVMAIQIPQKRGDPVIFDKDEPPRQTSLEKLAKLRPIYGSPTVSPGNAPGMNAGGSAIVIMSREKADSLKIKPLASIETMAWDAAEPKYMATLPANAIGKALALIDKRLEYFLFIAVKYGSCLLQ